MWVYIVLFVIIAIPIGLIIWRRRGNDGVTGTDPSANKNIGVTGPPNQNRTVGGPGGGPA
jgi:hypothetical protein